MRGVMGGLAAYNNSGFPVDYSTDQTAFDSLVAR
jgi:hypothetical protein